MAQPHAPPSPIDNDADERLCPSTERLALVANKHHFDFGSFTTPQRVVVDILRGHPLYFALSHTVQVPEIYLQQFWHHMNHDVEADVVVSVLADTGFHLTPNDFRTILHLPLATDGDRLLFDPSISDAQLCRDILSLGYDRPLNVPSSFHRNHLPSIWYTLFSILHRCLSAKMKGIDRCSSNFLRLFHAVAFNRHIDYAQIIWLELLSNVQTRGPSRDKNFVPYMCFLSIAINTYMQAHPTIRRCSANPTVPNHRMFHLAARRTQPGAPPGARLPDALLNFADPAAPSVIAYRESVGLEVAPMVQPEPAGPAQGQSSKEFI